MYSDETGGFNLAHSLHDAFDSLNDQKAKLSPISPKATITYNNEANTEPVHEAVHDWKDGEKTKVKLVVYYLIG